MILNQFQHLLKHDLLFAQKDQKHVPTTYQFFSLNITVIDTRIDIEQNKIYYNIYMHKDKLIKSQGFVYKLMLIS